MEADHLDHHGTVEAYTAIFESFVDRIEPTAALLVACADDPGAAALAEYAAEPRACGCAATAAPRRADRDVTLLDYQPEPDGGGTARISAGRRGDRGARRGAGRAHGAATRSPRCWPGSSWARRCAGLLEGIAAFGGVRRRFEFKGRAGGVRVYDDYAHHPTEVAAQLRAARPAAQGGRWWWCSSRTCTRGPGCSPPSSARRSALADEVVVLDVYGAREQPEPGVTGALVADAVSLPARHVHYEPSFERVPRAGGLARAATATSW